MDRGYYYARATISHEFCVVEWQGPIFDLFRTVKIGENNFSRTEGDVKKITDRSIGKTVYHIRGLVPAANYLQMPSRSSQSLGLTGRYAYVQFKPNPSQHFALHIDIHTTIPQLAMRLSFSNLFKEKKVCKRHRFRSGLGLSLLLLAVFGPSSADSSGNGTKKVDRLLH